jgi:hypothetical protein
MVLNHGLSSNVLGELMSPFLCFVFGVLFTSIGYYMGIITGREQGHRDGYLRGRAVSRQEFWRE